MVLGRAVGIGEDLTRAEHRAEDPAAHRYVTHVGGESVTEESSRLGLWQLTRRNRLWTAVDGERGDAGGTQIPRPVHIAESRDHPAVTAYRDDSDRGGSIYAAAAAANGEEGVGTERDAAAEHPARDGIKERNKERDAGPSFRTIDGLS